MRSAPPGPRVALVGLFFSLVAASASCGGGDDASTSADGGGADATASDGGDKDAAGPIDAAIDAAGCLAAGADTKVQDPAAGVLTVSGDTGPDEIADPSIFYPAGAPGGALAYSSVPLSSGIADQGGIRTRVAVSGDHGATWTFVAEANTPASVTPSSAVCPDAGACTAALVNETPSIVYDPTDTADRVWKIFTHRYEVVKVSGDPQAKLLYTVGHIAMYTAKLPQGPFSGPEVAVGWPGDAISTTGAKYLSTSDTHTAACGAFGEPGATLAPDGSLHLALGCIQPPFADPALDIVLLRSTDHGATWSYLSTPLRGSDGACFGGSGKRVNAVDLFTVSGTEYLMATPEGPTSRTGCVVFPFADAANGTLARDSAGRAQASRWLDPVFASSELAHYAGACTYGEGATGTGYTMSHLVIASGKLPAIHELVTQVTAP